MDEQLFRHFLDNLSFTGKTRLRLYHNGDCANSKLGEEWNSAEEVRRKGREFKRTARNSAGSAVGGPSLLLLAGLGNGKSEPLTTSPQFFLELLNSYGFSKMLPQSIHCNNGSLAYFVDYESEKASSKVSSLTILIQTPFSPYHDFSCVLRIDVYTGVVTSLLFDRTEENLEQTIRRLQFRCKSTDQSPLAFLTTLFEQCGHGTEKWRAEIDKRVVAMELRNRMIGRLCWHTSQRNFSQDVSEYEALMRDLHACNNKLIFFGDVLSFEVELGTFCGRLFEVFEDLRRQAGYGPFHAPKARDEFLQNLAYCMDSSRSRERQTQALKMRTQSQIDLLYSLISQRDSKINTFVAERSQAIAELAQLDSWTMKTIGLMTLIFLPGTLVASIFSTGVFNLRGKAQGDDGQVVAPLWWVFAISGVLLTLLVIGAWFTWTRILVHWRKRRRAINSPGEMLMV